MGIREIMELVFITGAVTGTSLLSYWYFTKSEVKEWVDKGLKLYFLRFTRK